MTGIVGTVLVLSLFAIAFYKLGERSARESQEPVSETAALMQETCIEPTPTTEATTVATTEATTAPIETTIATLVQTQPTVTPTVAPTVPSTQTGTVLRSAGQLKVRSGAGTNYAEIGRLQGGDTVTIYEQQNVNGMTWGNIGYGWVSMNYIVYGADNSQAQNTSAQNSQNLTGTVLRSAGQLKVRSGAGTNYTEIGRLQGGDTVTIYDQQNANGMTWGNIGYGWVSMDYIVFGEDTSVAPQSQKADYFGDWITDDEKLYMNITQYGNGANIRVVNTIADNVDTTWTMYGEFDEHGALRYWNGVRKDHNMGTETLKYSNGEGAIVVSNGLTLSWHESAEGPGEAARFNKAFNYRFPESTPNGSGVQQNPAEQLGMRGFSDNAVCDKVFASFKKKIQGGYSGAEILYHSSSYSDGYVTYDPGRCTYSCSMTAQYCSNIFDMWGTSTSTYFVTAELAEKNGSLVLTKMNIK